MTRPEPVGDTEEMADSAVFTDHEVIRLTKDGVFLSDGEPITHERTVQAFHRFLGNDAEGFFIRIGSDFKRIEVEDTAYFVVDLEWKPFPGGAHVELRLSDGSRETLDPDTLVYTPERLVCRIRNGSVEAKFLRRPYLELLMNALSESDGYTLEIGGKKIRLGKF